MFVVGVILILLYIALRIRDSERKPRGKDQPMTPESQRVNYQSVRKFVENNPDMDFVKEKLPEYLEDIKLTKDYEDLEARFKAGSISYADYQIELDELSNRIPQPVFCRTKSGWFRIR